MYKSFSSFILDKDIKSDDLIKDLKQLLTISEKDLLLIIEILPEVLKTSIEKERDTLFDDIKDRSTDLSESKIDTVLRVLIFFLKLIEMSGIDDFLEDLPESIKQLRQKEYFEAIDYKKLQWLLSEAYKECFTSFVMERRERKYKTFNSFKGIETNVIINTIWDNDYEWGDDIESYNPELVSLKPDISFELTIRNCDAKDESISFIGDEKALSVLLYEIKSAIIKLKNTKKVLSQVAKD